jgi:putative addiction module killer protein
VADLIKTQAYADWIDGLKDEKGRARILAKIRAFEKTGHAGDTKALGDGVYEMRFDFGPGYRVYYAVLPKRLSCWVVTSRPRPETLRQQSTMPKSGKRGTRNERQA